MAQLQNRFTEIVIGLRRLEAEEEAAAAGAKQPAGALDDCARRKDLKNTNASNSRAW